MRSLQIRSMVSYEWLEPWHWELASQLPGGGKAFHVLGDQEFNSGNP